MANEFAWFADPLPETPAVHTREKERLSYMHQVSQVDITQVTTPNKPRSYEVEVEMREGNDFIELARACKEVGQPNEWTPYEDRVLLFLNNVRLLLRYVLGPNLVELLAGTKLTSFR